MMLPPRVSLILVVIKLLVPHNLVHGQQTINGVTYRGPACNLDYRMDVSCKFETADFSDYNGLDEIANPIGINKNLDPKHNDRPFHGTGLLCNRIFDLCDGTIHQCNDSYKFKFHTTTSNSTHPNKQRDESGEHICLNDATCETAKVEKEESTTFKYNLFVLDKWISNKIALRFTKGYSSLLRVTNG